MTITTSYKRLKNETHRVYTVTDKNFSASASTAHKAIINLLNFYN